MMMSATSVASSGIVREVLTKDNYDNWSVLVKNYLVGRGMWDVLESNAENVKNKGWTRQNANALHIVQLSCGSEIFAQIKRFHTAKEAWNHLSASFGSNLQANPDMEQGVMDCLLQNRPLHRHVENNNWNAARSFINRDDMAIFSTSSRGRTVLHVAVIAGHEDMVRNLVDKGRERLLKMQDDRGYTALALAADLTGSTNIAKCMVEKDGGQDLLTVRTRDGEIPVLLAAATGHKEMTRHLHSKTPLDVLLNDNGHDGVLLLTRCIAAEIFDVALRLLQLGDNLPLTHESDGLQPLNALAHMPSAFPSGARFGLLQQLFYNFLKEDTIPQDLYSITTVTGSHIAPDRGPYRNSSAGRVFRSYHRFVLITRLGQFFGRLPGFHLKFIPSSILPNFRRLLVFVHVFVQNSILLKSSGIREIYEKKKTHHIVHQILCCLRQRVAHFNESQLQEASAYDAMLQAAKYGIIEFIDSMRQANPDLLWAIDSNKRGIFSHVILNRRENAFHLIHRVNGRKEIVTSRADAFGNNLLHLAGHLGPPSALADRPGAALQMQREIQWFKAVEGIAHPKCKEAKNADGKKPHEVFTEQHEELAKAGEKWAKDTASAFSIVGALITTIMFAAAFTLPGGNSQNGPPNFLHGKAFNAFIIADAVSLFASSTSVLIFIGILTSRYAERDFLKKLPWKFLAGLVSLLLSVVSMMVAFCAALIAILQGKGYLPVVKVALALATIPIMVFMPSQLRLFLEIFNSTMRSDVCRSIKKQNHLY